MKKPTKKTTKQTFKTKHTMCVTLKDSGNPDGSVKVQIVSDEGGINIMAKGYGHKTSPDGEGATVFIELHNGKLEVHLWNDINDEDCLTYSLEGARETARETAHA